MNRDPLPLQIEIIIWAPTGFKSWKSYHPWVTPCGFIWRDAAPCPTLPASPRVRFKYSPLRGVLVSLPSVNALQLLMMSRHPLFPSPLSLFPFLCQTLSDDSWASHPPSLFPSPVLAVFPSPSLSLFPSLFLSLALVASFSRQGAPPPRSPCCAQPSCRPIRSGRRRCRLTCSVD